ncbi:MAG: hypothetical protein MRJ65_03985 [Candidatus Brocadiaceae bacterium]|nr:hypothetical protein [Candidatus Brocadiaceae bacterium]
MKQKVSLSLLVLFVLFAIPVTDDVLSSEPSHQIEEAITSLNKILEGLSSEDTSKELTENIISALNNIKKSAEKIQQGIEAKDTGNQLSVDWLSGPFYTPRQYGSIVQLERNDIELGLRSDGVVVWRERGWYSYPKKIELVKPK